jgi:hypothetical protein
MKNLFYTSAVSVFIFAPHAWAGCTDVRQVCELRCRLIRDEINQLDFQMNSNTGRGGWRAHTADSGRRAQNEAAACANPGRQSGRSNSRFDCNTRSAAQEHQRNIEHLRQLEQAMRLQRQAEDNTCTREASFIQQLIYRIT